MHSFVHSLIPLVYFGKVWFGPSVSIRSPPLISWSRMTFSRLHVIATCLFVSSILWLASSVPERNSESPFSCVSIPNASCHALQVLGILHMCDELVNKSVIIRPMSIWDRRRSTFTSSKLFWSIAPRSFALLFQLT